MLVTMFTDSSFSQRIGRATWAAWAKADGLTSRWSGPVKSPVTQSGDGELAAIANGLYHVVKYLSPSAGSKIIIQTDSQEAIDALKRRYHVRRYAQMTVGYIHNHAAKHGLILDLRHVKGHRADEDRRAAVNTWCDRQCRMEMGKLLADFYAKKIEDAFPASPGFALGLPLASP